MFEKVTLMLPDEICEAFKAALLSGTWSNGMVLTKAQRRICEEALFVRNRDLPMSTRDIQ